MVDGISLRPGIIHLLVRDGSLPPRAAATPKRGGTCRGRRPAPGGCQGMAGQERGSKAGTGELGGVGAPRLGLVVVGTPSVDVGAAGTELTGGALVEETALVVAGALVELDGLEEVVLAWPAAGLCPAEARGAGGFTTLTSEPAITLTSAPPAGLPTPRTTAPASELITFCAAARWDGPS